MSRYPILLICLFGLLLPACDSEERLPAHELSGSSMGTSFHITIVDPAPDLSLDELSSALQSRLDHIENIASTYRASSDLNKFNLIQSTGWVSISDELCSMLADAIAIGVVTDGAFDITVGPLVDLWGFGPDDSLLSPPSNSEVESARNTTGLGKLNLDCDNSRLRKSDALTRIDLSGWAKGFAVDQLSEMLDDIGQDNYLVEIGGELKVKGHNAEGLPFAIAIENPVADELDDVVIIRITDSGVATSGDYRNFFEHGGVRYSHTLNPKTGRPVAHTLSAVTVIHPSTAYADGIATALLVLGPADGLEFANANAIAALFAIAAPSGTEYVASATFDAGQYLTR